MSKFKNLKVVTATILDTTQKQTITGGCGGGRSCPKSVIVNCAISCWKKHRNDRAAGRLCYYRCKARKC